MFAPNDNTSKCETKLPDLQRDIVKSIIILHGQMTIKKMLYMQRRGYYSSRKKKEILPLAITRMNLEDIPLTEISQ